MPALTSSKDNVHKSDYHLPNEHSHSGLEFASSTNACPKNSVDVSHKDQDDLALSKLSPERSPKRTMSMTEPVSAAVERRAPIFRRSNSIAMLPFNSLSLSESYAHSKSYPPRPSYDSSPQAFCGNIEDISTVVEGERDTCHAGTSDLKKVSS